MSLDPLFQILTWLASILGIGWVGAIWLSKQFADLRKFVEIKLEKVEQRFEQKLEYHERHDDKRFEQVQDDLWAIKLRNAARDGKIDLNDSKN